MLFNGKTEEFTRGLKINTVLIFNPERKPESKKPREEEIQDAKLLFFYPEYTDINIKRNLVGLSEGLVAFWDAFSSADDQQKKSDRFKAEYDDQTFVILKVEGDIWIAILFKFEARDILDQNDNIEEFNAFSQTVLKSGEKCFELVQDFYDKFFAFYGKLDGFFDEKGQFKGLFINIFESYIERYTMFLSGDGKSDFIGVDSMLTSGLPRFGLRKNLFLLSNHLEIILKESSDGLIEDNALFYNGHFIYGTMDYSRCLDLYKYFYGQEAFKDQDSDVFLNRFFDSRIIQVDLREHVKRTRFGYCIKGDDNKGVLMGRTKFSDFRPSLFTKINDSDEEKEEDEMKASEISTNIGSENAEMRENGGIDEGEVDLLNGDNEPPTNQSTHKTQSISKGVKESELLAYKIGKFLIIITLSKARQLKQKSYTILQDNITKLLSSAEPNFEKQFINYKEYQESKKLIHLLFYNPTNKSFTKSPVYSFSIASISTKLGVFISEKFDEMIKEDKHKEMLVNFEGYWIYLYRWNQRIVVFYTPGVVSHLKFTEEVKKVTGKMKDIFF